MEKMGECRFDRRFQKSEYFLRYQSLISNKILNTALKQYGYTMIFYPHYEIQKFISAFSATENIKIGDFKGYDVQTLLKESEMLIQIIQAYILIWHI